MIELVELITLEGGRTEEIRKKFPKKSMLLKILRLAGLPGPALYDLNKSNEAIFFAKGSARHLKIVSKDE